MRTRKRRERGQQRVDGRSAEKPRSGREVAKNASEQAGRG